MYKLKKQQLKIPQKRKGTRNREKSKLFLLKDLKLSMLREILNERTKRTKDQQKIKSQRKSIFL